MHNWTDDVVLRPRQPIKVWPISPTARHVREQGLNAPFFRNGRTIKVGKRNGQSPYPQPKGYIAYLRRHPGWSPRWAKKHAKQWGFNPR